MAEYTKKYARYIKLTKAKQDLLNPLLRNFRYGPALASVEEGEKEEGKKVEAGTVKVDEVEKESEGTK